MAKYVFILIEGSKLSFLKDSQPSLQSDDAWTAAGSPLRLGLEELFRGDVNFAVVDWPRGNNQTDRIKGVANLADCIRRLEREFPDSIYYAIGHSHGGNVGWLALNSNEEVFDRLSGLVCLGTPFICYNSTSIKLGRDSYVQSLSIALIVGGPLFYLLLLASLCSVWHCIFGYEFPWRPLLKVGVPVFMATPVALALGRANWVNTKLRRARSMLNELSNAPEKPELRDKLLIVRSIGDETGALPAFYVASWYISRKSEGFERRYLGPMPCQKENPNEFAIWCMVFSALCAIARLTGLSPQLFVIPAFVALLISFAYTQGWIPQLAAACQNLLSRLFIAFALEYLLYKI
jgi:pimeloyl-ACP methyl ester carboxylesterase